MVAMVGRKHSGKTSTVVKLVAELYRRGWRVMTLKHGSHTFNIDPDTTDTYRHYHEGHAERVVLAARDKMALVDRWAEELSPEVIAERYLSDADVVICEGYKQSALPKIEVFRRAAHDAPLYDVTSALAATYVGIITDDPEFISGSEVPILSFAHKDWPTELADLVERDIMHRS